MVSPFDGRSHNGRHWAEKRNARAKARRKLLELIDCEDKRIALAAAIYVDEQSHGKPGTRGDGERKPGIDRRMQIAAKNLILALDK